MKDQNLNILGPLFQTPAGFLEFLLFKQKVTINDRIKLSLNFSGSKWSENSESGDEISTIDIFDSKKNKKLIQKRNVMKPRKIISLIFDDPMK